MITATDLSSFLGRRRGRIMLPLTLPALAVLK